MGKSSCAGAQICVWMSRPKFSGRRGHFYPRDKIIMTLWGTKSLVILSVYKAVRWGVSLPTGINGDELFRSPQLSTKSASWRPNCHAVASANPVLWIYSGLWLTLERVKRRHGAFSANLSVGLSSSWLQELWILVSAHPEDTPIWRRNNYSVLQTTKTTLVTPSPLQSRARYQVVSWSGALGVWYLYYNPFLWTPFRWLASFKLGWGSGPHRLRLCMTIAEMPWQPSETRQSWIACSCNCATVKKQSAIVISLNLNLLSKILATNDELRFHDGNLLVAVVAILETSSVRNGFGSYLGAL